MSEITKIPGIHSMLPRTEMHEATRIYRDAYDMIPNAKLYQKEFGFYSLEAWKKQGLPEYFTGRDLNQYKEFGFHAGAVFPIYNLGWVIPEYSPWFDECQIEDKGETEIVRDGAGRHVLCFKGRKSGYMPKYIDHPVKDWKTWEEDVKWRLNPDDQNRLEKNAKMMKIAKEQAIKGQFISQRIIGGYMYLRSIIGPEDLLYKFYDAPDLLHDCMKQWLLLADKITASNQKFVTFDEVFFGEDICYNNGSLISQDMIKEFLFPYYQQLLSNIKSRQLDKSRKLFIQLDSDGFVDDILDLYKEGIGMNVCSPFEVASGSDVVKTAEKHPDLVISGGIDKRILASTKESIKRELERIIPVMKKRGGFIPTCDHGVPEEVPLENYLYYRKLMLEMGV